jgi:hypothetical protein
MTKKTFIALADSIREHNVVSGNNTDYTAFTTNQIEALADFCQSQNSNFNRDRFLGYIAGTNGPSGGAR